MFVNVQLEYRFLVLAFRKIRTTNVHLFHENVMDFRRLLKLYYLYVMLGVFVVLQNKIFIVLIVVFANIA